MPPEQSPTPPIDSKRNSHKERQPEAKMQEIGYKMVAANDPVVLQDLQDNTKQHYYVQKHTASGCVAESTGPPKSLTFSDRRELSTLRQTPSPRTEVRKALT